MTINKYIKAFKIAVGSTIAILIAYALGLNYATSAGIITLLTLQDTKKDTMILALKKFSTFILAVITAFIVFQLFSYNPVSYGVFLLLFVLSCYYLKIYDAIPINAVLATHYLLEKNMSFATIGNEAFLMLIGVGIGILLNLYIPSNVEYIRKMQITIEKDLKKILKRMAEKLMDEDKSDYNDKCFESLEKHISSGIQEAYANMNNTFFQENRYYIEYMELRKQQYKVLKEIFLKIKTLTAVPPQAYDVAAFINELSDALSESQQAKVFLLSEEELLKKLKESSLPASREEFENRAVLYMILMDFKIFLKMKDSFADSLTKEQMNLYWGEK